MTTFKKLQVEFAPGAFDTFDGTQEELDQLLAEITSMFGNMTAEDIESQTVCLDENSLTPEEWAILDAEVAAHQISRGQYLQ